ncbi:LpxI family protein [soil metagenome]
MEKLGLIAGGGNLPLEVAQDCLAVGRPLFVIRLKGFADAAIAEFPGADIGIAELGKCFKTLKREGCKSVCFAGLVSRPDFRALRPDLRGIAALPRVIAAARHGDDALLRALLGEFEREGFKIEGVHQVAGSLTLGEGPLGKVSPKLEHEADIQRALEVARAIGKLDVGQGAVVVRGLVLAVEAQEGTDAMLRRCAELPAALRGSPEAPCGVLAKTPKPIQERRIDLPTIGLATLHRAAKAGLAGIVGEADGLLVVDREAVISAADDLGLFVLGVRRGQP